jgi:RNA polymerase sigma-70 factor, ECF subfamily
MAQHDRDPDPLHPGAAAGEGPPPPADLERYRSYLMVLARSQVVGEGRRDRLDLSGVVQQTFLEAHRALGQRRGTVPEDVAAWLRRILANNLADALRAQGRAKRDTGRERSLERELERELEQSSVRMGGWLAAEQSSPSQRAQRKDRAVLLAEALAALPGSQREVVMLRHLHNWPLSRIADHLGRTPPSVVGLLQRGLKALRETLRERRDNGEL